MVGFEGYAVSGELSGCGIAKLANNGVIHCAYEQSVHYSGEHEFVYSTANFACSFDVSFFSPGRPKLSYAGE